MTTIREAYKHYTLLKAYPHSRLVELAIALAFESSGNAVGVPLAGQRGYDMLLHQAGRILRVQIKGSDRPILHAYFGSLDKENVANEFDVLLVSCAKKENPFSFQEIRFATASDLQRHIDLVKHRPSTGAPYITARPLRQFAIAPSPGFLEYADAIFNSLVDVETTSLQALEDRLLENFKRLKSQIETSLQDSCLVGQPFLQL